jgi:hypothetical protein
MRLRVREGKHRYGRLGRSGACQAVPIAIGRGLAARMGLVLVATPHDQQNHIQANTNCCSHVVVS